MSNSNNKGKQFRKIAFLAVGLTVFTTAFLLIRHKKHHISGEKVLDNVKKMFLAYGPIEGSWIELLPVTLPEYPADGKVFYGGISRKEADQVAQYEFIADAATGALLDLYKI